MNRRSFFQTTLTAISAIALFPLIAQSEERKRGGGATAAAPAATLVDPNDPAAKAVSYVHKNKNVKDVKLQTERTGVKFKDQKCQNCAFYQIEKEAKVGGLKAASCQMPFAGGKFVASEGWCSSWAKK